MAKNGTESLKERAAKQPRRGGRFVKKQASASPTTGTQAQPVQAAPEPPRLVGGELPRDTYVPPKVVRTPTPNPLSMPVELKWGPFTIFRSRVYGGPYREKPVGAFGVKMAEEISAPCHVDIPTRDFSVPNEIDLKDGLGDTLTALLAGERVYVGCMGGIGRSGLMMAAIAKTLGLEAEHTAQSWKGDKTVGGPVGYVRKHYKSHAVETEQQMAYIDRFDVSGIAADIKKKARRRWIRRGFRA